MPPFCFQADLWTAVAIVTAGSPDITGPHILLPTVLYLRQQASLQRSAALRGPVALKAAAGSSFLP